MAWDANKPAGSQKLRLSDDEIRANNLALEDALSREHDFPGVEGNTAGRHTFITLENLASSPSSTDRGILFCKGGEIYFIDAAGNEIQLTSGGFIRKVPSATAADTAITATSAGSASTATTATNANALGGATPASYRDASQLNAGTLPTGRFNDSSHGSRAGGSLHSVATTLVAGFMSAADKVVLNNAPTDSDVTAAAQLPSNFAALMAAATPGGIGWITRAQVYLAASLNPGDSVAGTALRQAGNAGIQGSPLNYTGTWRALEHITYLPPIGGDPGQQESWGSGMLVRIA